MPVTNVYKPVIIALIVVFSATFVHAADQEDLAKKSQNPVGNMISLPIEYWHYDGMANDASGDALVIKPVYPMGIGNVTLINRFIVPFVAIDADIPAQTYGNTSIPATSADESGLGNIQYQALFTPAAPGKFIWGGGPIFDFPSNSSGLGSEKWSGGLAVLGLTMPGNWVVGALIQNIWSFAGPSDEPDVNKFTFQYFVNYNLSNGWYLTSTPIMTADWEKPSGQQWTIPLGGGIGKLTRFGKQPVDFKLQGFGNVEKPDGGPEWSLQFAMKFLFPK